MTSRRVEVKRPGGYDRLEIVPDELPYPGPEDVRVAVAAVGVNFADCVVRMGLYASAKKYVGWPITPGFEFAGTVDATGANVHDLQPGDRVFGLVRFGAYRTSLVCPRRQLFRVPDAWSLAQAASFPVVFLTAWYALRELCRLRPEDRVLIHSAAGGVGGAAIQLAKVLGCDVIGVVGGAHKVSVTKALGCDVVLDSSSEPLWSALERAYPDGVDVVLDPNGQRTLKQSFRHLRPMGRLIVYGFLSMLPRDRGVVGWVRLLWTYLRTPRFDPLQMTDENKSVLAFNLSYLFDAQERLDEAMGELLAWVERGRLAPLPLTTYPFAAVRDAHRALQSGRTTGKLVLLVE